jgi:hypothetical protein
MHAVFICSVVAQSFPIHLLAVVIVGIACGVSAAAAGWMLAAGKGLLFLACLALASQLFVAAIILTTC